MKKQPKETDVKVIRAFRMGGEEVPEGTHLTLDTFFAVELISGGKAVKAAKPAPVVEPKKPEAAPSASKKLTMPATAKGE